MKKLFASAFMMALSLTAHAADFNADEVMQKSINTGKGFVDSIGTMTMVIYSDSGDSVERLMETKTLEVEGDGDKQLIVFQNPADVQGSAVLTHSKLVGNDDQWVYLPALRRVRRISSANKSGAFMGSEFAYEDLSAQEFAKFTYEPAGIEEIDGVRYFKIERTPAYERSGYSYQIVWIDDQNYLTHKVEMYDLHRQLYKTQTLSEHKNYFDNYWNPERITIKNHKNGRKTEMITAEKPRFNNGFRDREFDRSAMTR